MDILKDVALAGIPAAVTVNSVSYRSTTLKDECGPPVVDAKDSMTDERAIIIMPTITSWP
jgi:hypothetical protein